MALIAQGNEPLQGVGNYVYTGALWVPSKSDANGQMTVTLATGQTVTVTQATAANLKALIDINTGQIVAVTQATAANLKALVDINTGQSVTAILSRPYSSVAAFNNGGTNGAANGAIRDTGTHSFYLPSTLKGYDKLSVFIGNTLNQGCTVSIYATDSGGSSPAATIYSALVAAGGTVVLTPYAGAAGAGVTACAALAGPLGDAPSVQATCSVAPTSGYLSMSINGRA